jgi:hypothetical protein
MRKGKFFYTLPKQQPRETIVSFDAARLVKYPIFSLALLGELLLDGPWSRGWPGAGSTLD